MIIKIDDKEKKKSETESEGERPDDYDPKEHLEDIFQFRTVCPNMNCCKTITGFTNGQVLAKELVICPNCGQKHYISCLAVSDISLTLIKEIEQLLLQSYRAFMMIARQQELNVQKMAQDVKKKFDA